MCVCMHAKMLACLLECVCGVVVKAGLWTGPWTVLPRQQSIVAMQGDIRDLYLGLGSSIVYSLGGLGFKV